MFTWVYFLHAKSNVLTIFPHFFSLIHTQFGVSIKSIHSDNAPELSFYDFFRVNGIIPFHSCVDTP